MKTRCVLFCGLAALLFTGCAGNRTVAGLSGRWTRNYAVDEDEMRAHVNEVWQFNGATATSHGTWTFEGPNGEFVSTAEQTWSVKYRGRDVFRLEEKARRVAGKPASDLESAYDLERDGDILQMDGGPSDEPLRHLLETTPIATVKPTPEPKPTPRPAKNKKT